MATSLYWHDYETFGVDPQTDRPAQFAGLRTDLDLNPVGEPLLIYCRPTPDYLPSPEACLLTGITPQIATARGLCEAAFIARIAEELSAPGTCGLGYNTLRFDDEFTRNGLYRNFYDPYEREWKNGNSRWDLIDVTRLTAALRPDGIEWPVDDEGRPSFRLEKLTAANGIEHVGAHDALVDVRATIDFARLLKARQPRLFDFAWNNRGKRAAADLLALGDFRPVLHVSEKFPSERYCLAVVVALIAHPENPNGVIVFDLREDPTPLIELDAEAIRFRLYTRRQDLPEGIARIPLKAVHLNRCPVLAPINTLRPADCERLAIDIDASQKHLAALKAAHKILAPKLREVFTRSDAVDADIDPDRMIYRGGFFSDADRRTLAEVRGTDPQSLATRKFAFNDPRLPEMLFRYRARNFPETLTPDERARWNHFVESRWNGEHDGLRNRARFEAELVQLENSAPNLEPRKSEVLHALREFLEQHEDREGSPSDRDVSNRDGMPARPDATVATSQKTR